MKRTLCLFSTAIAIGTVCAQGPEKGRPDRGEPKGPDPRAFFRSADANEDGAVSLEEFAALERVSQLGEEKQRRLFARLDKNGDGLIRPDEMAPPGRDRRDRPPMGLAELDKDRDGRVSFDEFAAGEFAKRLPEDRRRGFFDRMDRNEDGFLSPEDRPERPGRPDQDGPRGPRGPIDPERFFRDLDADGDGSLDFSEYRKAPWVERLGEDVQEDRFEEIDGDGNLRLDADEWREAAAKERKAPRKPGPSGERGPKRPAPRPDDAPMMDGEGA